MEKTVIINQDEYKNIQNWEEVYKAVLAENQKLIQKNTELQREIMEGKTKTIKIVFETFLKKDYTYFKEIIDTIQFSVSDDENGLGIVGYEREAVFDKLDKLADAMKEELRKEYEGKYAKLIDEMRDKIATLRSMYNDLVDEVEKFNRKHLFKIKGMNKK